MWFRNFKKGSPARPVDFWFCKNFHVAQKVLQVEGHFLHDLQVAGNFLQHFMLHESYLWNFHARFLNFPCFSKSLSVFIDPARSTRVLYIHTAIMHEVNWAVCPRNTQGILNLLIKLDASIEHWLKHRKIAQNYCQWRKLRNSSWSSLISSCHVKRP